MNDRVLAVVPLRGGSKGIPGKNIKPLGGKPLCAWVLEAACASERIDEVAVSTDSAEIAAVVRGLGLPVRIIDRPAEIATDTATTEAAMLHAVDQVACDIIVTIQATSPLTTAAELDAALKRFAEEGLDSMVTGVAQHRFVWNRDGTPLNYDPRQRPMRQQWDGSVFENGAFYITRVPVLRETCSRLAGRIGVHVMGSEHYIELDEPEDWLALERILAGREQRSRQPLRVLVCDVDGTLTDGGMYYDAGGEAFKRFDTRDAHGLKRLRERGMQVWIITREDSAIVAARMRKLGIEDLWLGVQDKAPLLQRLCRERGIDLQAVAYVGDDDNDLACMQAVGFSACPADAQPVVRCAVDWISPYAGGRGAVRALCEHLIEQDLISQ